MALCDLFRFLRGCTRLVQTPRPRPPTFLAAASWPPIGGAKRWALQIKRMQLLPLQSASLFYYLQKKKLCSIQAVKIFITPVTELWNILWLNSKMYLLMIYLAVLVPDLLYFFFSFQFHTFTSKLTSNTLQTHYLLGYGCNMFWRLFVTCAGGERCKLSRWLQ